MGMTTIVHTTAALNISIQEGNGSPWENHGREGGHSTGNDAT